MTDLFAEIANAFVGDELAADPIKWAKERCGIHLWSIQQEIAWSVVNRKRTAVQSAHGMGKSFLAATLAAWWVDTPPGTMAPLLQSQSGNNGNSTVKK